MHRKLLGIINVDFNTTGQLLIIYSAFVKVLYNILIEFGRLIKLVRLMKMYLNEMYSTVRVGKHMSDVSY